MLCRRSKQLVGNYWICYKMLVFNYSFRKLITRKITDRINYTARYLELLYIVSINESHLRCSSRMEDYSDSFDFLFKIILVGDAGVGKTCIVQRFKNGIFIERQANTIGVDFTLKTIMVDGKKIKVSSNE